jgi:hypothetical protein
MVKTKEVTKKDIDAEESKLQAMMEEKKGMTAEYEKLLEEEKAAFEKFKLGLEKEKVNDKLRDAGKLVTMCRIQFHYQEEPGGTLSFTKQCVRYSLTDGKEYVVLKEIADHINTRKYPDRVLERAPGDSVATLQVIGSIPRCSATVLETWEKEYDPATDIPDQSKWGSKAQQIRV